MAANSAAVHPLRGAQVQASDPLRHVWLSASAGTGKTQVLSARVFRLLLRGVDPASILCLTFTKAGAAEMAGRINATLARWVREDDALLSRDLDALGERSDIPARKAARTLFAKVLEAPGGGIRIQTIHSFCQSLLGAFPVEAGLAPGFRPLEAREEAVLAREALATMLVEEERAGRGRLIDAIGALSLRLGEQGAESFLAECARRGEALEALPPERGIEPFVRRALDVPDADIAAYIADECGQFDEATLGRLVAANLTWGTATGQKSASAIGDWLAGDAATRGGALADLHRVFVKADGDFRAVQAGLAKADADYAELAQRIGGRCGELLALIDRAAYADLLAGALDAGRAYARAWRAAKARLNAVDFDDLIDATVRLLQQPGIGEWVRYKLDRATDHVLIDEAQDTNPRQWAIVRALADEFFAGEGAHGEAVRTLFSVGDYKQAIFGFQGSNPIFFEAARLHFERQSLIEDHRGELAPRLGTLSLTHSYRSTQPVLEFVDAAIAAMPAPGMGDVAREAHASEIAGPGRITLWPPVVAGSDGGDEGEEGWIDDATRALATRIARWVKASIGTLRLDSKGRMLRPEDVMILVKRRGDLASLLVARLYAEGVPVAGVDRLRLNAPLGVQDLLAAVRFVLQPDDDLSLASLLVSPLIGWSQDALMAAALRDRGSLWRHLRATQPEERLAPLAALLARADFVTPYQFLEEILSGAFDGRRKLIERLGQEARDPIEELLTAALTFETTATPSLQRFLDWFDRGDVEIKRDPSAPSGAVRVMTAHGAKGLQAPLVILADATVDPANTRQGGVLWTPEGFDHALPVFRPRKEERRGNPLDQVLAEAEKREREEHWRLFYVAATRAEEQLVVAGSLGTRPLSPDSWHAATSRALDALGVAPGEGERTFTGSMDHPVRADAKPSKARNPSLRDVPAWARLTAPEEARPPRPLAPSSLGEDDVSDPPPAAAMRAAAERGRLLHALFERLPGVPADRRRQAADRWLERSGGIAAQEERAAMIDAVLAILEDPAHAELFGPDSLAEAPIAATVGGAVVAGTADRLVITDTVVRVVDFKTGRHVPAGLSEVPPYHVRQLAAYAAALGVIFSGRRIEAALLYSSGPRLIDLPADLLARYKPDLSPSEQSLPAIP